ncbi:MAG TPA: hypothetical protein VL127_06210 [Bryobacteraceae bacterium]|jgi:hypothetical protein|nr:hypothetical protein [Bryobacteraceae bacterium]
MVYANSLLNLAWVALCVAAFTWFLVSNRRRAASSGRLVMGRGLALALALVSLFPCVSASDDSVRLALLNAQASADTSGHSSWSAQHSSTEMLAILVGLLEVLESAQVSAILALAIALCLFSLALTLHPDSLDRFLPSCAGRAPPASLTASL